MDQHQQEGEWHHPMMDSVQPARYETTTTTTGRSTYQCSYGPNSTSTGNHHSQPSDEGERTTPTTTNSSTGSGSHNNLPLLTNCCSMMTTSRNTGDHRRRSHRASPIAAAGKPVRSCAVLFNQEPVERAPSPTELTKSEYHSKYKDFNEYAYVENLRRWIRKPSTPMYGSAPPPLALKSRSTEDEPDAAKVPPIKEWYSEVEERNQQACKYRARSLLGASNMHHSWDGTAVSKDREFQALALATRMLIEEKRKQKSKPPGGPRSASAKPAFSTSGGGRSGAISSAPPSLRATENMATTEVKPKPVVRKTTTAAPSAATKVTASPPPPPAKHKPATKVDKNNNATTSGNRKPVQARPAVAAAAAAPPVPAAETKKIWIKPKTAAAKPATTNGSTAAKPEVREYEVEPKVVPLRNTQIKSPEQITGVKSPSPESWNVTIEKGGLNWVNGTAKPVNFAESGPDSLASGGGMVRPVPINGKKE